MLRRYSDFSLNHAHDLALVLVAAHVDVAKVALECLEQVQIVGGLVVVDDLPAASRG